MQTSSGPPKHLLEFFTDKKVTLDVVLRQIPYTTRCTHCLEKDMCNGYHNTLPPSINIAPEMIIISPKPTQVDVRVNIRYMTKDGPKNDYACSLTNLPSVTAGWHTAYNLRDIVETTLKTARAPHPALYGLDNPRIAIYTLGSVDPVLIYLDHTPPNPDHY